jgi:heme exporter protein C
MSDRLRLNQAARILLGVWMAGIIVAMFLVVPQYVGLGDAGRIIILHVPTAWITTVAFAVSAVYSVRYLWKRRAADDAGAVAAAEAGFLFCVLATVSGMWFANIVWGNAVELGSTRDHDSDPVADLRRLLCAAFRAR